MCGIVGYVTNKPRNALANFMGQGLIVDSLRGMCGTGIYAFDTDSKEALVWKRALAGYDFVNSLQFEQWKDQITKNQVVIGHNRASTIGSAKDRNCHPFVYDHIGLVHNGTLRNHYSLLNYQEFKHDVDSAYAAKAVSKYGAKEALEKIEGAFVFVWHDMHNNTLNIARNSMRDIWYITDKEGENLYYASEYEMLAWLLDRNGLEFHGKFRSPAEFHILTWEIGKPYTKPKVTPFEEYKPKYQSWNEKGRNNFKGRDAKELEELGLEEYEQLEVVNCSFEPYPGTPNAKGKIDGIAKVVGGVSKLQFKFRMHGLEKKDFEAITGAKRAFVTAASVWYEADIPVITCRGFRTCDKEEDPVADTKAPVNMFPGPDGKWLTEKEFLSEVSGGCCYCNDPIGTADAKELKWVKMYHDVEPLCRRCGTDPKILEEIKYYTDHPINGCYGAYGCD